MEQHGIEYIPEGERTSRPLNIFWILSGSSLTFPLIVIGWVPISLGLSWWASFWAILSGALLGSLLLSPMALLSPQTGTNNPVSSSAFFGVKGRLIGSVVGLLLSVLYGALAIWSGGDAISAALSRLIGTSDNAMTRLLWYTLLAIIVTAIASYGHSTMLRIQKIVAISAVAILLLGLVILWPQFNPHYAGSAQLTSDGFWVVWVAGAAPAALISIGYGLAVGDWTRHISSVKHTPWRVAGATFVGGLVASAAPLLWGALTASLFEVHWSDGYAANLIQLVPLWYTVPLLYLAIASGASQGTVDVYSTGLDWSSIVPAVRRVPATIFIGFMCYIVVFFGTFYGTVIDNLLAAVDIIIVCSVSFIGIVLVGHFDHNGRYDHKALQDFMEGRKYGRYWFDGGWSWRAVTAFTLAMVLGLASAETAWYTGMLVPLMGGANISFILSLIIGPASYALLLLLFPQEGAVYVYGRGRVRTSRARSVVSPRVDRS